MANAPVLSSGIILLAVAKIGTTKSLRKPTLRTSEGWDGNVHTVEARGWEHRGSEVVGTKGVGTTDPGGLNAHPFVGAERDVGNTAVGQTPSTWHLVRCAVARTWHFATLTLRRSQFTEIGIPSAISASPCAKNSDINPSIHG